MRMPDTVAVNAPIGPLPRTTARMLPLSSAMRQSIAARRPVIGSARARNPESCGPSDPMLTSVMASDQPRGAAYATVSCGSAR